MFRYDPGSTQKRLSLSRHDDRDSLFIIRNHYTTQDLLTKYNIMVSTRTMKIHTTLTTHHTSHYSIVFDKYVL